MNKLKVLLIIIGVAQLVLGFLALFFPAFFVETAMKLSPISTDLGYPLGMLASRFIVLGIAMFVAYSDPIKYKIFINGMILIQIIDLVVGIYYTSTGGVALSASALAMFDALASKVQLLMINVPFTF